MSSLRKKFDSRKYSMCVVAICFIMIVFASVYILEYTDKSVSNEFLEFAGKVVLTISGVAALYFGVNLGSSWVASRRQSEEEELH